MSPDLKPQHQIQFCFIAISPLLRVSYIFARGRTECILHSVEREFLIEYRRKILSKNYCSLKTS